MAVESDNRIPGWLDPLRRTFQTTLSKSLAVHRPLFQRLLFKADTVVDKTTPGHDVFRSLFRVNSNNLPSDSQIGLTEQLRTFQVDQGTTYDSVCHCSFSFCWMKSLLLRILSPGWEALNLWTGCATIFHISSQTNYIVSSHMKKHC